MGDERDAPNPVNLTEFMDSTSWTLQQKLVLALGALAFMMDGCANQILGVAIPAILAEWQISKAAMAPVAAIGLAGITFGAICGGLIADRIGRRWTLIMALLLFGISTMGAVLAPDPFTLAIVRFFDGLGLGAAIPSGAAMLTETSPPRRRAIAIAIGMAFIPFGGFLAGVLGGLMLPVFGWRSLFLLVGAAAIVTSLLFVLCMPESPFFLALRPERERELNKVMRRLKGPIASSSRFFDVAPTYERRKFSALFAGRLRLETISAWLGFFFCLLATYSLFSWLPTLLHGRGFGVASTSFIMGSFNGGATFGGLLSGLLIQRHGVRLPLMTMTAIASGIALLLCALPLDPAFPAPILLIFTLLGLLLAGVHNGFYTLSALIYPSELRATGIGAAAAFGRVGAIASSFTGVIAMNFEGVSAYFGLIALALIGAVWSVKMVKLPAGAPLLAR